MAEFYFYATRSERLAMLEGIFRMDGILMYGYVYDARPSKPLSQEDIERLVGKGELAFFLYSPMFSQGPLPVWQVEAGLDKGKWHVGVTGQGPLIEVVLPPHYERDGVIRFAAGDISYSIKWLSFDTAEEKAEAIGKLKDAYQKVIKEVKGIGLKKVTFLSKPIWVSPGILAARGTGCKLQINGKWEDL